MSSTLQHLTDATFERTITQADAPILVTFTAPVRCPACRQQKPALEALAFEGYPVFVVDVEKPDSAYVERTWGGRGVPFHKLYSRGKLLLEHLGVLSAQEILQLFERANAMPRPPKRRGGYASVGGFLGGFGRGELS